MEKFTGKLSAITPSKLIHQKKDDSFDSFFLVLGVIYNDLKGLILFYRLFLEKYEDPKSTEPNCHYGEYDGVKRQLDRLVISFLSEMFVFLKTQRSVWDTVKFKVLIKNSLDSDQQKQWIKIISCLEEKTTRKSSNFLSAIAQIRGNITYHYDHSYELKKSYRRFFFSGAENEFQKKHITLQVKLWKKHDFITQTQLFSNICLISWTEKKITMKIFKTSPKE